MYVISRDLFRPLILECKDSSKLHITIIHFDGCVNSWLQKYTTVCSSIALVTGTWTVSRFLLLRTLRSNTLVRGFSKDFKVFIIYIY